MSILLIIILYPNLYHNQIIQYIIITIIYIHINNQIINIINIHYLILIIIKKIIIISTIIITYPNNIYPFLIK